LSHVRTLSLSVRSSGFGVRRRNVTTRFTGSL
jgi:hypothetical protein